MIGNTILQYQILEKLGEGGMGVVYKAKDTKLERTVALKFLPKHISSDEAEKRRFIHEARSASSLDHPNICTIHEIGETDDGQLFIAMAYYGGESLKEKIENGPLKFEEAIDIAIQVTQGLITAHEADIVHRDIKPANIMLTGRNEVKIVDFGLAKAAGQTRLTKTNTTLGTMAYMSPEQSRGEAVDHRTDIWALGVVLYEMLSGRQPFKGEYDQAVLYSIINEEYEHITSLRSGVPIEIDHIVDKALTKNANERYQHIDEVLVDLRKVKNKYASKGTKVETVNSAPEKNKERYERKLTAIMFTDVVGYTAIMGADEARASGILRHQKSVIATKTKEHKGQVLKEIGDGNLCSFSSSVEAVNCAVDIQNALKDQDFKIRIGLHVGDVVFDGDEIYGDGVNITSRIEGLAQPGCICISRTIFEQVRNQEHINIRRLGEKTLKNVSAPIEIYEILVESPGEKRQHTEQPTKQDQTTKQKQPTADKKPTRRYVVLITSVLFLATALFFYFQKGKRQPIVSDLENPTELSETEKPDVALSDIQRSANQARQAMVKAKSGASRAEANNLKTFLAAIIKEEEADLKYSRADYQAAALSFEMARDLFQKAQRDMSLKNLATIAMNEMSNAKTKAESTSTNSINKDLFELAEKKEKEARKLFSSELFQEAAVAYGEAHQAYLSVVTDAGTISKTNKVVSTSSETDVKEIEDTNPEKTDTKKDAEKAKEDFEKNTEEVNRLQTLLNKIKSELPEKHQLLAEFNQAKEAENKGDENLYRQDYAGAILNYKQAFQLYEKAINVRQDQIKQIQSAVVDYKNALINKNIEQLGKLYVNFSNERKQWTKVFENIDKVEAQMTITNYDFQEEMVLVLVAVQLKYSGFSTSENHFKWEMKFVETNGDWLISGINTVN